MADEKTGPEVVEQESANSQEICRVCRSEGTTEQPLFYPCLCSGSIKYIHQDCLIEWLKHSRKKYCELCKHPFAFSPVYAERMPHKIPPTVVLWGLCRKVLRGAKIGASLSFAAVLWVLLVPVITSHIFQYYFGWSLQSLMYQHLAGGGSDTATGASSSLVDSIGDHVFESAISIMFDVVQGFLLTALTVFLVVGMMLVREFLSMLQTPPSPVNRRQSQDRAGPHLVSDANAAGILPSGDSSASGGVVSPLSPSSGSSRREQERRREFYSPRDLQSPREGHSPRGVQSPRELHPQGQSLIAPPSNATGAFWLDQVHPKEYRNYLRRRELHRERMEQEQIRTTDSFIADDNESDMLLSTQPHSLAEDHVSNISTTSTLRSRFSTATGVNRGHGTDTSRCRICVSSTCINRDHVVQASQMRNSLAAQRHQSILLRQQTETQPVNEVIPAPPPPVEPDETPPAPTATLFGWNLDAAESLSLPEFFGFTATGISLLELLQNASIVVGCNALVMHLFLFVPYMTGLLVANGALWRMARMVGDALLALSVRPAALERLSAWMQSLRTGAALIRWDWAAALLQHIDAETRRHLRPFVWDHDSFALFVLHVLLGYATLAAALSGYVYATSRMKDPFHRTFIPVVSFIGTFCKLLTLLSVEIALFPMLCGWMLDLATLPLFPHATLYGRLEALARLPVSVSMLHWAVGAVFMIAFSSLVSQLRTILRPGLFFFLRNPADPDNHPVRDMLDRPLFEQLARLAISAAFYAGLVGSSVGVAVHWVLPWFAAGGDEPAAVGRRLLPLNLRFGDPLSEVPIDLLLNLLLRSLVAGLQPGRVLARIFTTATRRLLRALRLSSYFVGGGRFLDEEAFPHGGTWVAVPDFDRVYTRVRLREIRQRAITPLDIARLRIVTDRQGVDGDAGSGGSPGSRRDWTPVFRPRHFLLRWLAVLVCALGAVQLALCGAFVAPILLGRQLVVLLLPRIHQPVHEVYTWTAGAIVLLLALKTVDVLMIGEEWRTEGSTAKRWLSFSGLAQFATLLGGAATKLAVIAVFFVGVCPLAIGTLFTLILAPLLYGPGLFNNNDDVGRTFAMQNLFGDAEQSIATTEDVGTTVIVFFAACWSIGFPLLRLLWSARHALPLATSTVEYLEAVLGALVSNWSSPLLAPRTLLRRAVLPVTLLLLVALLLPPLVPLLLVPLLLPADSRASLLLRILALQRVSHLLSLALLLLARLLRAALHIYRSMLTSIRDDAYLVGRRLHNLESRPTDSQTHRRSELVSPIL